MLRVLRVGKRARHTRAHSLQIETGRFGENNTPRQERSRRGHSYMHMYIM